jgi:hypothetical protein
VIEEPITLLPHEKPHPRQGKLPTGFISCAALSDVLEQVLARCRAEIRQRQQELFPELPAAPARPLPHPKTWKQQPPQHMERTYQVHRSEREERFRHIMELRAQGLFFSEIAKRACWHGRTERASIGQARRATTASSPEPPQYL